MADGLRFQEGFYCGTATSSHQAEGDDCENHWWLWEQEGGHSGAGTVSGPACDH